MKKYLLAVFLLSACLVFSGCAGALKKDRGMTSPGSLEPQTIFKFSDVPVPTGFTLIPESSYSFESAGLRVGLLKYEGKADIDRVVSFYKEQMAMYNWRLLNSIEYGERMLNFDRELESCIVNLSPKGKLVMITVAVGPKSGQSAKKADKPLK